MTIFPPTYLGNSRPCDWCSESYPNFPSANFISFVPQNKGWHASFSSLKPPNSSTTPYSCLNPPLSLVGQLYPSFSYSLPQILDLKPPFNTNFMTRPLIGQMDSSLASLFTSSSQPLVLTRLLQVHKQTRTLQPLPLFPRSNINHFLSHI